jgi:hypothetical protein
MPAPAGPPAAPPASRARGPAHDLARGLLWAGVTAAFAAITAGFTVLYRYDAAPGAPPDPPVRWPAGVPFAPDAARPTLVLFAHPRCPCTGATIGELDRLAAHCGDRLALHVLFFTDPRLGPDWARTDLWDHAARIPGVHVHEDPAGDVALRFGARTSGTVVLYAPNGRLQFRGGITTARGHAGDSPGAAAIAECARTGATTLAATAVYGCELR